MLWLIEFAISVTEMIFLTARARDPVTNIIGRTVSTWKGLHTLNDGVVKEGVGWNVPRSPFVEWKSCRLPSELLVGVLPTFNDREVFCSMVCQFILECYSL